MTDAEDEIDSEILQLAKQAVEEGQNNGWSMDQIVSRLQQLVSNSGITVVSKSQVNGALEQASYIKDFEPGYDPSKDYPVEQEDGW